MIELLKYLANNLGTEQLLEVAHIVSKNPEMIDQETFLHIINEVNDFEMRISEHNVDELSDYFKKMDNAAEIRQNSTLYKLLKDNNISLN